MVKKNIVPVFAKMSEEQYLDLKNGKEYVFNYDLVKKLFIKDNEYVEQERKYLSDEIKYKNLQEKEFLNQKKDFLKEQKELLNESDNLLR